MPLPNIKESYGKAWKAIAIPVRIEYSIGDLGVTEFVVNGAHVKRTDFQITNIHGRSLACSFFENTSVSEPLPCVIYCHANGSCRLEALQYKQLVLTNKWHYACFDFTACGQSEGTYGSVGIFEQDDVARVIEFVKSTQKVTKIALWGRSMGAVTSIMYSNKDPSVTCVVLDSPFATFKRLVHELVKSRANIPSFLVTLVMKMLRRTVKKKAQFDINHLKPIAHVNQLKIPALYGAPQDDTFVSPQHTKDLYMAHGGHKRLMTFEGDHNSQRPMDWVICVIEFLKAHLNENKQVEEKPLLNINANKVMDGFGKGPKFDSVMMPNIKGVDMGLPGKDI